MHAHAHAHTYTYTHAFIHIHSQKKKNTNANARAQICTYAIAERLLTFEQSRLTPFRRSISTMSIWPL